MTQKNILWKGWFNMVYRTNLPNIPKIETKLHIEKGMYLAIVQDGLGMPYNHNVKVVDVQDDKIVLESILLCPVNECK